MRSICALSPDLFVIHGMLTRTIRNRHVVTREQRQKEFSVVKPPAVVKPPV
jgi:hypothetical protein